MKWIWSGYGANCGVDCGVDSSSYWVMGNGFLVAALILRRRRRRKRKWGIVGVFYLLHFIFSFYRRCCEVK
jgi:hypothetical protein